MSEGLGTAAKTVMEITSFLFPDDIPKELIVYAPIMSPSGWTGTKKILLKFQAPVSNPLHPVMYR
jgi:hypothetical protein